MYTITFKSKDKEKTYSNGLPSMLYERFIKDTGKTYKELSSVIITDNGGTFELPAKKFRYTYGYIEKEIKEKEFK